MIPPPNPGDRVRITEGTFASFVGVVQAPGTVAPPVGDVDAASGVVVTLNIFGRETTVLIHAASLEPA